MRNSTWASFENLIQRYEEPNSMVRWDAPLFTVTWSDESVPGDDIWKAITSGDKRPANQAVAAVRFPSLRPCTSTLRPLHLRRSQNPLRMLSKPWTKQQLPSSALSCLLNPR
jgi:tRNA uridine 5-carbamoylmethylation protein Kti12